MNDVEVVTAVAAMPKKKRTAKPKPLAFDKISHKDFPAIAG